LRQATTIVLRLATDTTSRKEAYSAFLSQRQDLIDSSPLSAPFDQEDVDHALTTHATEIKERLGSVLESLNLNELVDFEQLYKLSITALLKQYTNHLSETGIVVAGYGDKDYLPRLVEYRCYGSFLGKVLFEEKARHEITLDKASEIVGFASTAMVETFTTGISPDAYYHIVTAFRGAVESFAEGLQGDLGVSELPNLAERIESHRDQFVKSWYFACLKAHYEPLGRVVGMLPLDEMAELAETLINLESLKEKVTQPTQSVGGPIDVAVITKIDGFIWVKRKHYFRPELNPRFFARKFGR
jgi:hypothetical protein